MKTYRHKNGKEVVVIAVDAVKVAVPKSIFDQEYDPNYTDVLNVTVIADTVTTTAEPFPPFDSCQPSRVVDAPGYEDLNMVTDNGIVLSKLRDRIIASNISDLGYERITPYRGVSEKEGGTVAVHRLVAMAFVPNPDNKPQVNHVDGNKTNNHYSNLEWCTVSENHLHAYATGLRTSATAMFSPDEVREIRSLIANGNTSAAIAELYNVPLNRINNLKYKITYRDTV